MLTLTALGIGARQNPAAALSQITESIPTLFGELVYIARTFNALTGAYGEPRLNARFSRREVSWALGRRHRKLFADWLAMGLEEQTAELKQYLDEITDNCAQTLRTWMQTGWYKGLVPHDVRPHERSLFSSDMETLLTLVYRETSAAAYE